MKETLKTLRNVVVFGVILYAINYGLDFIVIKMLDVIKLDDLYEKNAILYAIIIKKLKKCY